MRRYKKEGNIRVSGDKYEYGFKAAIVLRSSASRVNETAKQRNPGINKRWKNVKLDINNKEQRIIV